MTKTSSARSGLTLSSGDFLQALQGIAKPKPVTLYDLASVHMPVINEMLAGQGYTLQAIVTGLKKQFPAQKISEDGLRRARMAWFEAQGIPAPDLRGAKSSGKAKPAATAKSSASAPAEPAAPTPLAQAEPGREPTFEEALEEATQSAAQSV